MNIDRLRTLGDWKAAVPNLKQLEALPNTWNMSASFTSAGIPLVVQGTNGHQVIFFFNGLSIQTDDRRGGIYRIDVQNSWMSLAEVRSFGTELLGVLGKDDPAFYA